MTNLVGNYDNGRLPWSLSLVASVLARVFLERRGVTKFWSASRMALLFRSSESSNPILSWACTLLSCGWAEGGCRQGQESLSYDGILTGSPSPAANLFSVKGYLEI